MQSQQGTDPSRPESDYATDCHTLYEQAYIVLDEKQLVRRKVYVLQGAGYGKYHNTFVYHVQAM